MKKVLFFILISLFSVLALADGPNANDANGPAVVSGQQQDPAGRKSILLSYLQTYNQVQHSLAQSSLSDARLTYLHSQVRNTINALTKLHAEFLRKQKEQQLLLSRLGSAPTKDQSPEDEVTAKQRIAYAKIINDTASQLHLVENLLSQGQALLDSIYQKRRVQKAMGLVRKSTPLYDLGVLSKASHDVKIVINSIGVQVNKLAHQVIVSLKVGKGVLALIGTLILIFFLAWPVRARFNRFWSQHQFGKHPNPKVKVTALISRVATKGLIPAVVIFLLLFALSATLAFDSAQQYFFRSMAIALSGVFIVNAIVSAVLSINYPAYRLVDISESSSKGLLLRLQLLINLIALVWFFRSLTGVIVMPPDFVQLVRFVFRLTVCIIILLLLKRNFWYKLVKFKKATSTRQKTISFLRQAAILITVTNPVLILLGYVNLANMLFDAIIQTCVLIAGLFFLQALLHQGIPPLFLEGRNLAVTLQRRFAVTPRGRELLQYWLVMLLSFCVWVAAFIVFAIIWGLDPDRVYDWGNALLFGFTIGNYQLSLINIVWAIIAFALIYWLTRRLQQVLEKKVFPYTNLDHGATRALNTAVSYAGILLAIVVSVNMLGFEFTSLLYILGGLSVGIGLALKPVVTNFISGLIMLVDRPIKHGDIVEIAGEEGVVTRVGVRATEVLTWKKATLIIPNAEIMDCIVKNWTHDNRTMRLDIAIGVAYGSDTSKVSELLLQCANDVEFVKKHPAPVVKFTDFGDSSLDFVLRAYIDIDNNTSASNALRNLITQHFEEANIEIPFPQRDIRVEGLPMPDPKQA